MDSKYFRIPFGTSGDLATVPDAVQPDGSVSYTSGWGPDYSLDPGTNPAALLLPRDKSNQVYFDITKSLARLQQFFAPQWITSADNGGTSYAYALGALVLYTDGSVYQSIVAANTVTPGTDPTKWIVFLSNFATSAALTTETNARIAADALLAPKANPTLTGAVNVGTRSPGDSTDNAASTAFVGGAVSTETNARIAADALLAPKANPTLTGAVNIPTASTFDNSTLAANTQWLQNFLAATGLARKAWCAWSWNGTTLTTITSSGLSISRTGTGLYTITAAAPHYGTGGLYSTLNNGPNTQPLLGFAPRIVANGAYILRTVTLANTLTDPDFGEISLY